MNVFPICLCACAFIVKKFYGGPGGGPNLIALMAEKGGMPHRIEQNLEPIPQRVPEPASESVDIGANPDGRGG